MYLVVQSYLIDNHYFLFEISSSFKTIAVTGTSGKSTTSGLLAFIMKESGLAPNLIGGGRVKQFITSVDPGNYLTGDSNSLIIEACESDGSIVNLKATDTVEMEAGGVFVIRTPGGGGYGKK